MQQTMEVLTDLEAPTAETSHARELSDAYNLVMDGLVILGDQALRDVIARANEYLEERDSQRKKTALSEAKRLLKAAGIDAKIGKKKERK